MSGALAGGVEVTAINAATGVTSRAVTDEEGLYRLLYLPPAGYNVTYRKPGFSPLQRTEVMLRSNDTLTLDVQLAVGNIVERIEVTASTPLLETATSTTGTVLAGRQMNALPIMQRYAWMAMYVMPGVTSMNGFHIAGQRDRGLGLQHGRHIGYRADPWWCRDQPHHVDHSERHRRGEDGDHCPPAENGDSRREACSA